jgi:polar amino acid transport system substrate-binding protein
MERVHSIALCVLALLPLRAWADRYTCVSFEYPPLIQSGSDGRPAGLAVEIVSRVFQQMGHSMKVDLYPWARSLAMVKHGDADCIFTLYHSPEREQFLDYSNETLLAQTIYLFARKGTSVSFNGDLSSLKGVQIGTAHKVNYGPRFEEARPQLKIDEAPTIEQNFRKLAVGRIDVVPSHLYTAVSTLELPSLKPHAEKIVRIPTPVEIVPSHIAFPKVKNMTALRDAFDAELRKLVASGEYRRLLDRYKIESAPEAARLVNTRKPLLPPPSSARAERNENMQAAQVKMQAEW